MIDSPRPRRCRPTALGFILLDLSGAHRSRDEQAIRDAARRLDYRLADVLAYRSTDFPDTLDEVLHTVGDTGATTLIIPALAHIDRKPCTVQRCCRLITIEPERTWEQFALARTAEPGRHR